MCAVQRVAEKEGSPRDMVGSVQEGRRESVYAVVDRVVEGGEPRGSVEREVNVGGVRPFRQDGGAGFDGRDRTGAAHIGWRQEGDRPIVLNREGQVRRGRRAGLQEV